MCTALDCRCVIFTWNFTGW